MNGTWLELSELSSQLQLCGGGAADPREFLNFGTSLRVACDANIETLLENHPEPILYDLYYYYAEAGAPSSARLSDLTDGLLYPVPVRVLNLQINGQRVNDNVDSDQIRITFDDQLTRRFFAVDAASGVSAYGELPRVVRYLKSATLVAQLMPSDAATGAYQIHRILPPYLEVEYADVAIPAGTASPRAAAASLASTTPPVTLPTTFEAVYTMDVERETLNYLFVTALVVWVLVTIFKGVITLRRNQATAVDGVMMARILAQACDVFAHCFFTLLLGIAVWTLIAFKGQNNLFLLLPTEYGTPDIALGIMPFRVMVAVAFGAKIVHMIDVLYVQTQHGIYLIDWEQPRSLKSDIDHDAEAPRSASPRSSRAPAAASSTRATDDSTLVPVSVWRTIFVANEWVKLQDVRAISIELNLIALLFLLRGIGLEDYATLTPNGAGADGVPAHIILRFGLSSSLLLALSLTQWLLRWALWERYVKDRIWQFVDLLAVTNVSCFLLEERHFGFYLHGRSVHDHADADMLQLNSNLKREEGGLEMLRGFRQDSTVQTFEVYLTPAVRQKYDAAFEGAFDGPNQRNSRSRRAGNQADNKRRRGFRAAPEEAVQAHQDLRRFLMTYLGTPAGGDESNTSSELRPEVRKKRYWEQLVGWPPEQQYGAQRSIFLEDVSGRFKRLLLAGREADMVLLAVLTYATLDMATSSTFVAIFATYAIDVAVRAVRAELATRNIAAKTLLDDRFLL